MEMNNMEQVAELLIKILAKVEKIEMLLEVLQKHSSVAPGRGLLKVSETAQLLNLAVSTLYSKVSRNEIPVCKRGNRLYFDRDEILEWVRSGRIKTVEEIRTEVGAGVFK